MDDTGTGHRTDAPTPAEEDAQAARLLAEGLSQADVETSRTFPTAEEIQTLFPALEILDLLGQGGMGVVYKARQRKLDRLVALKVLPRELGDDPAFAERFAREARTLARLDHPHIVRLHEFGEVDGLYHLVMEHVDGANLRQVMDAGRLGANEALAIVPQVCEALQYAHEHGVVHRDVKPENILLDESGRVKIADFGLAKLAEAETRAPTLTGTRQVMGTWLYMAPEQYRTPQQVDHRADIFSLGVVFYEMLTGNVPVGRFQPPSEAQTLDHRIDAVVMRALEREREERYQEASEVQEDLEGIAAQPDAEGGADPLPMPGAPSQSTGPNRPRPGRRAAILSGLALGLGIAAALVAYLFVRIALDQDTGDANRAMAVTATLVWSAGLVFGLLGLFRALRPTGTRATVVTASLLLFLNALAIPIVWMVAGQGIRHWERRIYAERRAARPPTPEDARRIRLKALNPDGRMPRVTGTFDHDTSKRVTEGILRAWAQWWSKARDRDFDLETARPLYAPDALEALAGEDPAAVAERCSHGLLGLPLTPAEFLGTGPHTFTLDLIQLGPLERKATVTAVKAVSPYDRTLTFRMERLDTAWHFSVAPITLAKGRR